MRYRILMAVVLCVIAPQCAKSSQGDDFIRDIQNRVSSADPYKRKTAVWILKRDENIKSYISLKCIPIILPLFSDKDAMVRDAAYADIEFFFLEPPKTYYEKGAKIVHGYKIFNPKRLEVNDDYRNAVKIILPVLLEGLKDNDEQIIYQSISALGSIGSLAEKSVPMLLSLLNNKDNHTRKESVIALANIGERTDAVINGIKKMLNDEDKEVRKYSKQALDLLQNK